ncbi:MAG: DUF4013 domain-containing protein [Haloplanus sp.]
MTADLDSLVRWPLDTEEWPHTVLVGALLVATTPLVVPAVLLAGYAVRLLSTDIGDDALPSFAGVRALGETGTRAVGIVAAYHLPPLLLLGVGAGGLTTLRYVGLRSALRPTAVGATLTPAALSGGVAVAAGVAVLPLCGYLSTIAVTAYAATGSVGDAFAAGRLRRRACSTGRLRAWLLASLVVVGSGVVAFLLGGVATTVPGVGAVLVGAVRFYGGVVALGVWNAARPTDCAPGDDPTGTAAVATDPEPT